jgi:hypothetical protein
VARRVHHVKHAVGAEGERRRLRERRVRLGVHYYAERCDRAIIGDGSYEPIVAVGDVQQASRVRGEAHWVEKAR